MKCAIRASTSIVPAVLGIAATLSSAPAFAGTPASWADFQRCIQGRGERVTLPTDGDVRGCCTAGYCIVCDADYQTCSREEPTHFNAAPDRVDTGSGAWTTPGVILQFQTLPNQGLRMD